MHRCELCDRLFCEKHLKPRLIFIRGLKEGYFPPESIAEFQKEWKDRENSHPDFQYSRKRFEELHLEEKMRFELINKALNGENFSKCPKCHVWYNLYEEIVYCPKCGFQVSKKIPHAIASSKSLMRELADYEKRAETMGEVRKEAVVSEGPYHFTKRETEIGDAESIGDTEKRKRHLHISAVGLAVSILVFLAGLGWFLFFFTKGIYLIFIIPFIPFPIPFWVFGIGAMVFGALGFIASLR